MRPTFVAGLSIGLWAGQYRPIPQEWSGKGGGVKRFTRDITLAVTSLNTSAYFFFMFSTI